VREERTMRKLLVGLAVAALLSFPICVCADEGLAVPEALEKTISLDGLTGISLFFARAYQTSGWLYALYCTLTMGILGTVIAFVTDFLLQAIGMDVHKIEHRE
jgi:ABC-type phosphate/phosphonate transport system permease subunit